MGFTEAANLHIFHKGLDIRTNNSFRLFLNDCTIQHPYLQVNEFYNTVGKFFSTFNAVLNTFKFKTTCTCTFKTTAELASSK